MSENQIIDAIKKLAHNGLLTPDERKRALEDIECAAQLEREKLEERYEDE